MCAPALRLVVGVVVVSALSLIAEGQPRGYNDTFGAWSPDGTSIAFVSNRDGDPEIYVAGVDGSRMRRLTRTPGRDAHPSWSPDGRRIAFQSPREGGPIRIFVMNADGSAQRAVTKNNGFCGVPVWSPDGKRLAFQCSDGLERFGEADTPWRLFVMDAESGPPVMLSTGPGNDQVPNWSPDGRTIVFYSDRTGVNQVYLLDVASRTVTQLTRPPGWHRSAAFSPDGQMISFMSDADGSIGDVYVMDRDGRNRVRLTTNGPEYGIPLFSPDGRRLIFQNREGELQRIWVMDRDGKNAHALPLGGGVHRTPGLYLGVGRDGTRRAQNTASSRSPVPRPTCHQTGPSTHFVPWNHPRL